MKKKIFLVVLIVLILIAGLFILTGKKLDILYYYNAQNETINKICKFSNSHDNGALMLEKENNRLFAFGGKNTVSCEYYSFKEKKDRKNFKHIQKNSDEEDIEVDENVVIESVDGTKLVVKKDKKLEVK